MLRWPRHDEPFLLFPDEMNRRGWSELDVLIVSGDAYVDHPSYGTALIGRLLECHGYNVGIIAQPDWGRVDGSPMTVGSAGCRRDHCGCPSAEGREPVN